MPLKVAIYEDNNALRESLSHLIQGSDSLELCGAYPDCMQIIQNCTVSQPHVILMDIDMPGISGIEATSLVKSKFPEIDIMMLTVYEDRDKVFDALCAGATGYLLKKATALQIVEAITELNDGGSPMSGEIARKVLEFFSKPHHNKSNDYALSSRELDILKCLVKGDSYKMIASSCFISIGTVRCHINSIYKKLTVNSKSEAVVKAMKERLV
ncbi:MAG TPA: response regulator transcription factor [Bacteroidales bacterium]|jgi:DNA-binding NarL/FixJ family response regulator|nr:response regulator transcription factor [Bacteroidales bacterium]